MRRKLLTSDVRSPFPPSTSVRVHLRSKRSPLTQKVRSPSKTIPNTHTSPIGAIGIDCTSLVKPATAQTPASLAYHLKQAGAKLYGASWCPYTRRQAQLFGDSFSQVQYIECYPNSRNGEFNSQCQRARVFSYPTWVIGARTNDSMMSIQELANFSNYGTPSNTNDKVKICDYKADLIFYERNPQMLGRKISSSQSSLANEWSGIRRNIRGCQ